MRTGDLNKRITWQSKTKTPDGMGGFTEIYIDVCTVWCAIWPVSANEIVQANSTTMVVSHKIRQRFLSGFKASWRGKFGDRYFSINSIVNPNERNEMLDVMCKEAT